MLVACPNCGQQINVNMQVTKPAAASRPRKSRSLGLDSVILWTCIAGGILMLMYVIYLIADSNGDTPLAVQARIDARAAVLARAKYPRDAELSLLSDYETIDDDECEVHGTVKLVNGIGAKHTVDYWVRFKIKDGKSLEVKSVRFHPEQ